MTIHPQRMPPLEFSARPSLVELDKLGLSLADAFEPGLFSAKQTSLTTGRLLLLRASDGWCWALVTKVVDGLLVLAREAPVFLPPGQAPRVDEPVLPLTEDLTSTRSRRAAA